MLFRSCVTELWVLSLKIIFLLAGTEEPPEELILVMYMFPLLYHLSKIICLILEIMFPSIILTFKKFLKNLP